MKASVLTVGKLKEAYWRDAAEEYAKRLASYLDLEIVEVQDRDCDKLGIGRTRDEEGAELLKWLARNASGGMRVMALDIAGKQRDSVDFAKHIEALKVAGCSHLVCIIGGAVGLSDEVLAAADERVSLGLATWPHNLARVMLLEQLYRACRIAHKHPYHK
ncbi:MAG: 23S rRNA (pseudouridine(1915)-N(3))-methyltransferase RlmH [Actinomycetes bacterium]|jgi:23S rRNA (pseudouridine1915-N3)-methyltransferase|nr:23S rRNA (pseudouridine(1915)-N(3))-methyltransferase RlmH [Actinomycetes bacterium]